MRTLNIAELEMVSAAGISDNFASIGAISGGILGAATGVSISGPFAAYAGIMALVGLHGADLGAAMLMTSTFLVGVTAIGAVGGAAIGYGLGKAAQMVAVQVAS